MCWAEPPVENHGVDLGSLGSLSCTGDRHLEWHVKDAATLSAWEAGVLLLIFLRSSTLPLQSKKENDMLLSPKFYLCLTASALAWARAHQIVTHLTVTTDTASEEWSPGHSTCCCLTEPDRMANDISSRFSFQSF